MTPRKPPRQLTEREAAFVREYLVDKNATQAAIRAGYSARSAGQQSHDMLQRPIIKAALAGELRAQAERTLLTADKVLLDIQHFGDKAAKAGEYHAAIRSRELLGKHLRLFTDKVELTGKNDGPVEFSEIRRTVIDPKAT